VPLFYNEVAVNARIKEIISFSFLVVFINYYSSVTLFSNTHVISGATITHSHVHKDSHHDTKSGGHTEQSITLIAQISQFEFLHFTCCNVPSPLLSLFYVNKLKETAVRQISVYLQNPSLRAPPVCAA
jgi:hypothetical protein